MIKSLKWNWLLVSKLTWGIDMGRALKSLKDFHSNELILSKLCIVWAKNVQRSYLSWHWRVMQNLKKANLWFEKCHEEFGKFSPDHLEISKLGLWWGPVIQSRKCMSLKFTEELWIVTMKNDATFREELICCFKTDIRNLTNFDPSTGESQQFSL